MDASEMSLILVLIICRLFVFVMPLENHSYLQEQ